MELFRPTLILGVILPLIYAVLFLPGCLFANFSLTIKRQVASDFCKSLYVYHFITIANAVGALVGLLMKASDHLKWVSFSCQQWSNFEAKQLTFLSYTWKTVSYLGFLVNNRNCSLLYAHKSRNSPTKTWLYRDFQFLYEVLRLEKLFVY